MALLDTFGGGREMRIGEKLAEINWGFVLLLCVIASIGVALLYSAAGQNVDPWASRQASRFAVGLCIMIVVAMVDLRTWMKLAYPAYAVALVLLIGVELFGRVGGGAERWIVLGPIQIQPSELMKITLILALARYLHGLTYDEVSRPLHLLIPIALIGAPVGLVLMQPNLGTATILALCGGALLFLAGLSWRVIVPVVGAGVAAIPFAWNFLHDYQKQRVLTLFNPESDPLGAGYNIIQAKIALGSGGLFGKGFGENSQSALDFLPEKQTDFIFTMLGEEFGLLGCLALMGLFLIVLGNCVSIALSARSQFGRLVAMGVGVNFLLYILINVSMVMGVIPVVGIPLPLISYGGTAMMTVMFGFGLLMCVHVHRYTEVPRNSFAFW